MEHRFYDTIIIRRHCQLHFQEFLPRIPCHPHLPNASPSVDWFDWQWQPKKRIQTNAAWTQTLTNQLQAPQLQLWLMLQHMRLSWSPGVYALPISVIPCVKSYFSARASKFQHVHGFFLDPHRSALHRRRPMWQTGHCLVSLSLCLTLDSVGKDSPSNWLSMKQKHGLDQGPTELKS